MIVGYGAIIATVNVGVFLVYDEEKEWEAFSDSCIRNIRKKYCISAGKEIHKMKNKAEKNKYFVIVQSQADLSKKRDECSHSRALFCINLFGGYATLRKHAVFSK